MDAHKRKALSRIILCFSLFLILRLAEELLIIPLFFNTRGLIACLGGSVILAFYLRFIQKTPDQIGLGFSRRKIRQGILLAASFTPLPAVIAYTLEYSRLSALPGDTVITVFYDSAQHSYAAAGFRAFAMWLAIGMLVAAVHAFFYETAFRGLLITLGAHAMRFWKINLLQAGLYAFWFLLPLLRLILYDAYADAAVRLPALFLAMLVYQMLTAIKLGLLRASTGSVWGCVFDHFAFACMLDMIHVQHTSSDMTVLLDQNYALRLLCCQAISLLLVVVYYLKKKAQQKNRSHSGGHHAQHA